MNDNFKFVPGPVVDPNRKTPPETVFETLTPELKQAAMISMGGFDQSTLPTEISQEELDAAKRRAEEWRRRYEMGAVGRGLEDFGNTMTKYGIDTTIAGTMQASNNPWLAGLGSMYSAGGGWEGLKTADGRLKALNMGFTFANSLLGSNTNYVSGTDGLRDINTNVFLKLPIPEKYKFALNAATFAVGATDKLGAREADLAYVDKEAMQRRGASFGGSTRLALLALDNNGKKFGLFHGTGDENRLAAKVNNQWENIALADSKQNLYEALGRMSDLTSMRRLMDTNGGYDIRVAKKGGVLQRLSLYKKLQSKLPYKVDVETDAEIPIIREFKEGGSILHQETIEEDWPIEMFNASIQAFKEGGKTEEPLSEQKNVIPEGALHAHKHHMEDDKGLTKKGIPVVDGENEQTAEIERNEIIFTLEVTKKLEELAKDGSDEAAIEAGELLVKEILDNTEDRTGLIKAAKNGGVLNGNT